ncbi:hypothetical protein [Rhodohalobacter sp.]|uniref:hypothetical protein n=1 Tax=Rhodohalobacter sp. TaxID=1974210 RepID=UPI0035695941
MNSILKIVSFCGLMLTIVPSFLVFSDTISFQLHTTLMLIGMILWFTTSPFWMKEKKL